jgi:hypothetical protein
MDIDFLIKKWKEFRNNKEEYNRCMGLIKAREKNIPKTNKLVKDFIESESNDISNFKKELTLLNDEESELKNKKIIRMWKMGGFKGIVLLTLLLNYSSDKEKIALSEVLRKSFAVPKEKEEAGDKINSFSNYIGRFRENIPDKKTKNPNKNLIRVKAALNPPYASAFIPVFWNMQELDKFPIYYTSCEKVIKKIKEKDKYYKENNPPGENYKLFYDFNNKLIKLLTETYNEKFHFYDISNSYLEYISNTYLDKKKKSN